MGTSSLKKETIWNYLYNYLSIYLFIASPCPSHCSSGTSHIDSCDFLNKFFLKKFFYCNFSYYCLKWNYSKGVKERTNEWDLVLGLSSSGLLRVVFYFTHLEVSPSQKERAAVIEGRTFETFIRPQFEARMEDFENDMLTERCLTPDC